MQRIQRILSLLKSLHFRGLTHHGREQSAHQPDHSVLQFAAPAIIGCMAAIGDGKPHTA